MRLPTIIEQELNRVPGRWRIEPGRKHFHIMVDDCLVGILPKGTSLNGERDQRGPMNLRAQIRRHLNQFPA